MKRKFIRMLFILTASSVLLLISIKSSELAKEMEMEDDIVASLENSFVEGDFTLELSSKGNFPIYYTLDGSVPSLNSNFYKGGGIFLAASQEVQSCVVRAATWDEEGGVWGDVFTRTYFYAQDLEAVQERFSTYIVCLTSDPVNLYDYEKGILVEGKVREDYINSEEYIPNKLTQPANFTQVGEEWERDVYVEILSPDGERLLAQDAGIRIFGHASRQYYYKSFKLYAREEYGNSTFAYPLFSDNLPDGETIQDSYERLVLRSHGFDKSITLFREELFQRLCSYVDGIDSKSVAPASVWLNGSYYNFQWMQEVYDERYMDENYGRKQLYDQYIKVTLRSNKPRLDDDADDDDLEAAEEFEKVLAYADLDMTDDGIFADFCELVDVENMMQYFAIETYIANSDWPLNNVRLYRYKSINETYGTGRQDGRWRYLYYDMEAGFNIYNEAEENWLNIADVIEQDSLFRAVIQRTDMQKKFAEYLRLCICEYFTKDRVYGEIQKLKEQRDGELSESLAYKQSIDENYTLNMEEVERNIEVIYDFVEKRPALIQKEVLELFGIDIS